MEDTWLLQKLLSAAITVGMTHSVLKILKRIIQDNLPSTLKLEKKELETLQENSHRCYDFCWRKRIYHAVFALQLSVKTV